MELLQLKYFCDAAETENFSKTAKKYLVPTSNISQSIKRLERELGCELFEHSTNKITLNGAGKQFYTEASQALILLESAKARALENSQELNGDIHIICLSNRRTLTNAIEHFIQKHPQVNIIIHHSIDADRDFDVFVSDACPYEYSKKILLVDEDICVAMNKNNPLANRTNFTISDLENERFISMTPDSSLYKNTVKICADAGFTPNIAIQTDDPFYVRKYIEMGLGISFVPTKSWKELFPDSVVLKKLENVRRNTYAFLPKRKYIKPVVEVFLQFLNEEAAKCYV